jgi:aarF domain-containing kinase
MTAAIGRNLASLGGITVPGVVEGMVSRRVLVTEYLHGRRLLDPAGLPPGFDGPELARRIAGAYGHQIMVDGLFQADPHPGNILLLPDSRVALLDFGLTKELPREVQAGFAQLVVASADRDVAGVLAAFRALGVRTKSDGPEDVLALVSLFFDSREIGSGGADYRRRTTTTLARNPVEAIPGDLVLLGRVVGLLRGVSSSLGSPLSPMQMLKPYAEALLSERG